MHDQRLVICAGEQFLLVGLLIQIMRIGTHEQGGAGSLKLVNALNETRLSCKLAK